jgi:membrane-associated phospholipid phosphatase
MQIVTWLGSNAVVFPAVILVGALLVRRKDWRPLALLGAAAAGAIALYDIFKPSVGRSRPPPEIWIGHYSGHAFPSGHATVTVAFYAMLAFVLSKGGSPRRRVLVWSGAALVVLVVGASRVYLGAHWLTDVLGGYALGTTWAAVVIVVMLLLTSRRSDGRQAAVAPIPRRASSSEGQGGVAPVTMRLRPAAQTHAGSTAASRSLA